MGGFFVVISRPIQYLTSSFTRKKRSPFEVFIGRNCNFDLSLLREECRQSEEIGK